MHDLFNVGRCNQFVKHRVFEVFECRTHLLHLQIYMETASLYRVLELGLVQVVLQVCQLHCMKHIEIHIIFAIRRRCRVRHYKNLRGDTCRRDSLLENYAVQ